MRAGMTDTRAIDKAAFVGSKLDERGRRVFAAGEVRATGWGGLEAVSEITGLAPSTIGRGLKDLDAAPSLPEGRVRRKGGGRRHLSSRDTTLIEDLRNVIEPATLGDPMRPRRALWRVRRWRQCRVGERRGHKRHGSVRRRLHPPLARRDGARALPESPRVTITADGGGSNGECASGSWNVELQKLADETGLVVPGTSKWNKIEHRLFCHITQTWRGRPLVDRMAVELIAATTTKAGLSLAGVRLARHAALPPLGASRVASISLCMRAAANTPVGPLGAGFAHFPSDAGLPRFNVRVGPHITLFGACSAFTTRCSPHARRATKVTLYTEGFSRFVTSTTAPIATGWSESCRVGLSPTGKSRLCTAHVEDGSNVIAFKWASNASLKTRTTSCQRS